MTGICYFRSQHSRTNSPDWGTGWTNNKANWIGCDYSGRKPTSHVPTTPRWVSRLISRFLSLVTCSPLDNSRTPLNIAPLIAHTEDPIPFDTKVKLFVNKRASVKYHDSWISQRDLSLYAKQRAFLRIPSPMINLADSNPFSLDGRRTATHRCWKSCRSRIVS